MVSLLAGAAVKDANGTAIAGNGDEPAVWREFDSRDRSVVLEWANESLPT